MNKKFVLRYKEQINFITKVVCVLLLILLPIISFD